MEYSVEIVETLKKTVAVEADSPEAASELVREQYRNQRHILTSDDFLDVDFICNQEVNNDMEIDQEIRKLWMCLGVDLIVKSQDEEKALFDGDVQTLKKIMKENRFIADGDSYIPNVVAEQYNKMYGTQYPLEDVDFDVDLDVYA